MPSLFTLPSVQGRLQASTFSAAAKPSAPPVVRPLAFSASKRAQRQIHVCQAAGRNEPKYDENDYITAGVEAVRLQAPNGPVILLKIDSRGTVLPVYVGDTEARALLSGISNNPVARPLTHDLMKNSLALSGFKVTLARITALVGNTYHARMHLAREDDPTGSTFDVDARPSDAINMAVRFSAPVLVSRDVANKMGVAAEDQLLAGVAGGSSTATLSESHAEIVKSCEEECRLYNDPTVMEQLQLQMAVEAERYEEASQLRDKIDHIMQSDRAMSLVVAIESALKGKRYEEAARLREELRQLRTVRSSPAE